MIKLLSEIRAQYKIDDYSSLKYNIHLVLCILYQKTNAFLVFVGLRLTHLISGKPRE